MAIQMAVAALNQAADSLTLNTIKLHSGDCGADGTANTIAGAEAAASYGAAANGERDVSSAVEVAVTAGTTVSHFSIWNGATFVFGDQFDTAPETYANDGVARVTSAKLRFIKGA